MGKVTKVTNGGKFLGGWVKVTRVTFRLGETTPFSVFEFLAKLGRELLHYRSSVFFPLPCLGSRQAARTAARGGLPLPLTFMTSCLANL